jgi:translation initiation factor IF-2
MSEEKKSYRLFKLAKDFNVSVDSICEELRSKGIAVVNDPNTKISADQYEVLQRVFGGKPTKSMGAASAKTSSKDLFSGPALPAQPETENEASDVSEPVSTGQAEKKPLPKLQKLVLGTKKPSTSLAPESVTPAGEVRTAAEGTVPEPYNHATEPVQAGAESIVQEPVQVKTVEPKPEPSLVDVEPVMPVAPVTVELPQAEPVVPATAVAVPEATVGPLEPAATTLVPKAEQIPAIQQEYKHEESESVRVSTPDPAPSEQPAVPSEALASGVTLPSEPSESPDSVTTKGGLKVVGKIDLSQFERKSGSFKKPEGPREKDRSNKQTNAIAELKKQSEERKRQQEERRKQDELLIRQEAERRRETEKRKQQEDEARRAASEKEQLRPHPEPENQQPIESISVVAEPLPDAVAAEPQTIPAETAQLEVPMISAELDEAVIRARDHTPKLTGLKVVGKIDLPDPRLAAKKEADRKNQAVYSTKNGPPRAGGQPAASPNQQQDPKRQRKRKDAPNQGAPQGGFQNRTGMNNPQGGQQRPGGGFQNRQGPGGGGNFQNRQGGNYSGGQNRGPYQNNQPNPNTTNQRDANNALRSTLSGMQRSTSRQRQIMRRDKRHRRAEMREFEAAELLANANVLQVTEFLTAAELANLMDVSVNEVIAKCLEVGLFVSINQRIDKNVIELLADEFGYEVNFVSVEESITAQDDDDDESELVTRAPIVTVMGHVDHGKTSLLDYIRNANVISGEAGGITQHIGAYEVQTEHGTICFLDTPGHEAFTAMRARGAQVTDLAIIVIAADDQVMPQTREAINHAQAANVKMVFAINKMDKPGADPEKIRRQLADMNLLVEDWGGEYQCQEISAKHGTNVDLLLEKVLAEAELMELRANPNKSARGTVIEAQLDKGRGVVATLLVQSGTLRVGDIVVANTHHGRVKAMMNERNVRIKEAGPSTPVRILGLDGVPAAGDKFQVFETEREARELTSRRQQLVREQSLRMQKHITLEEIARRSAIGDFKELNVIIKADVDGSAEALADSLIKLSTQEVVVRIVMKGVGQISESDVLLASASNAIIVGFQVRPSANARKLAQQEQIDIRHYSVIYNAINEIKTALEGLLSPDIVEEIESTVEVREVFRIAKVGAVAGCLVTEGKIVRNHPVRVIRDGIVIFTGKIQALKRFKDDVREVSSGFECGILIESFNDIQIGDIIESFTSSEVKRTLQSVSDKR